MKAKVNKKYSLIGDYLKREKSSILPNYVSIHGKFKIGIVKYLCYHSLVSKQYP